MPVERIAGLVELDVVGKHDRQLVARDRHRAAAAQWMIGIGVPQ